MRRFVVTVFSLGLLVPFGVGAGERYRCSKPVETCLNEMVTRLRSTGFIGVELEVHDKHGGFIISKIIQGTPAEIAGIKVGDQLYAINGITYSKANHEAMGKLMKPGKEVTCTVKRNGENKEFQVTLAPMPADRMAKYIGKHMMSHAEDEAHAAIEP